MLFILHSKIEDMQSILDISQMTTLPPDLKSDSSSGDSPGRGTDHGSAGPNLGEILDRAT